MDKTTDPLNEPNMSSESGGSTIFVGNGGEGVLSRGKVYLRDLFESGIHTSAYFGPQIDNEIIRRLDHPTFKVLNLPTNLLARKLTDIQRHSPHLGIYLISAIEHYRWLFINEDFTPVPDDGSPLMLTGRRLPLANRHLSDIRLHRPSWELLSPEHKIALVLHEVVYSLIKPVCYGPGPCDCTANTCFQSSRKAREIISFIFDSLNAGAPLPETLEKNLNLPSREVRSCTQFQFPTMSGRANGVALTIRDADAPEDRAEFIKEFCDNFTATKSTPDSQKDLLTVYRPAHKIEERLFWTGTGEQLYEEKSLAGVVLPNILNFEVPGFLNNGRTLTCQKVITDITNDWLSYNEMGPHLPDWIVPGPSCTEQQF